MRPTWGSLLPRSSWRGADLDEWRTQGASGRLWRSVGVQAPPEGVELESATLRAALRKKSWLTPDEWSRAAGEARVGADHPRQLRTDDYVRVESRSGVHYWRPADGNRALYVGVNSPTYLTDAGDLGLQPSTPVRESMWEPPPAIRYDAGVSRFTTDCEGHKHAEFFAALIEDVAHVATSDAKRQKG